MARRLHPQSPRANDHAMRPSTLAILLLPALLFSCESKPDAANGAAPAPVAEATPASDAAPDASTPPRPTKGPDAGAAEAAREHHATVHIGDCLHDRKTKTVILAAVGARQFCAVKAVEHMIEHVAHDRLTGIGDCDPHAARFA